MMMKLIMMLMMMLMMLLVLMYFTIYTIQRYKWIKQLALCFNTIKTLILFIGQKNTCLNVLTLSSMAFASSAPTLMNLVCSKSKRNYTHYYSFKGLCRERTINLGWVLWNLINILLVLKVDLNNWRLLTLDLIVLLHEMMIFHVHLQIQPVEYGDLDELGKFAVVVMCCKQYYVTNKYIFSSYRGLCEKISSGM